MAANLDKLFPHLRGRTELSQAVVEAGGKNYFITHPASADALFDEEEFEKNESIPYWADLWPSAIALARHVSSMNLAEKRAIELGCGVGLPSVVAMERGAEAVATDHYPSALDFAAYNAEENVGKKLRAILLDWRNPEPESLGKFDLILAADVLYERVNARHLAGLVPKLLAKDGEILLADPRRPGAELFTEEMEKQGFRASEEDLAVEQGGREVAVIVHHFTSAKRVPEPLIRNPGG